jgi:hypothetical protein
LSTSISAFRRLAAVSELAERLLRDGNPLGSELALILTQRLSEPEGPEARAMLELALWAQRYSDEIGGERVASLVLGEIVSLYIDQGKSEAEFVGAMVSGWHSIRRVRVELGIDPPAAAGVDSSSAGGSRIH